MSRAKKMSTELVHRVAVSYYKDRSKLGDIANLYGLTRYEVGLALEEAEKSGIVTITITPPDQLRISFELERELMRLFPHLTHVHVTSRQDFLDQELASSTAQFLNQRIWEFDRALSVKSDSSLKRARRTLGIGGGEGVAKSLALLKESLQPPNTTWEADYYRVDLLPIVGCLPANGSTAYENAILFSQSRMRDKLTSLIDFTFPAFLSNEEQASLADNRLMKVFHKATAAVKWVVADIVPIHSGHIPWITSSEAQPAVDAENGLPVGHISGCPYFGNGTPLPFEFQPIGLGLNRMRQLATSISVSVCLIATRSMNSYEYAEPNPWAVLGALRGQYCNCLFINQVIAQDVIAAHGQT